MSKTSWGIRRIGAWLKGLRDDQRGNVVVFFAFSIIPMLSAVGIALDVANIYMARSKLQGALDSGAIAGAKAYFSQDYDSEIARLRDVQDTAKNYLRANLSEMTKNGYEPNIYMRSMGDNEIEFTADLSIKTSFSKFLGFEEYTVSALSAVTAGQAKVTEIVLALDNTSSMFTSNRFVLMREASKDFATKMFNQTNDPTMIKIAVVPWASTINIKSEKPDAASTAAVTLNTLSAAGSKLTPIAPFNSRLTYIEHHETGVPFFSTAQVNAEFGAVDWRGCIRAAEDEREVNSGGQIKDVMTDEPPSTMRWPIAYLDYRRDHAGYTQRTNCVTVPRSHNHNSNSGGGGTGGGNTGTQASLSPSPFATDKNVNVAAYLAGEKTAHTLTRQQCTNTWIPLGDGTVPWCSSDGDDGTSNAYWPADEACSTDGRNINGTKKACVSDPNEFAYFASGEDACDWEDEDEILPWDEHKPIYGPNLNCPTAMLPLSSNRKQVIRKLDHMYPVPGGTHADVGLLWALRALSPRTTWNTFWGLTTEQAPLAFNSEAGRKIVVLLTDGENRNAEDYEGYWGCSGDNRPGGVGDCWKPDSIDRLDDAVHDDLMIDSCETMKDTYGIELYTIAVDINSPDSIDLLRECASSADHAFNITAAELSDTFEELAQTNLRIIR